MTRIISMLFLLILLAVPVVSYANAVDSIEGKEEIADVQSDNDNTVEEKDTSSNLKQKGVLKADEEKKHEQFKETEREANSDNEIEGNNSKDTEINKERTVDNKENNYSDQNTNSTNENPTKIQSNSELHNQSQERSANEIYQEALNETRVSYKLDLFIEGYENYPEDSRFITGIEDASLGLLIWARSKHNSGDYDIAIDRYNRLINLTLSEKIKESAQVHLTYAQNKEKVLSADSYSKRINSLSKVSDIFNESLEGFILYPEDQRFRDQLNKASNQLLNWAKSKHDQGDFEVAADRYNTLINTNYIEQRYKDAATVLYQDAKIGKKSPNAIYNEATNETRASYKLDLFIEGYENYPEDSRFITGIEDASLGLLIWARSKHNSGDYDIAIDRYNRLVNLPTLSEKIKESAQVHLTYAQNKEKVLSADSYSKRINSLSKVSDIFNESLKGFILYPEDQRFRNQLNKASNQLLNWAKSKHDQGDFEVAENRYITLINTNYIEQRFKDEAKVLYQDVEIGKRSADAIFKSIQQEKTASGLFELNKEGLNFYPNDTRFVNGLKTSSKQLLDLATRYHNNSNYQDAITRYNDLLTTSGVPQNILKDVEFQLRYSSKGELIPNVEEFANYASQVSTVSGRVDAFLEGFEYYDRHRTMTEGILDSAKAMLDWATLRHNEGQYSIAIERYNIILNLPVSDSGLTQRTQYQKEYAITNQILPNSDQLYNDAISSSKASYQFDKFVEGFILYPEQKRFADGIALSSRSLLNLATRYHLEENFEGATDRYKAILDSPAVPYLIYKESELSLNYSKNNTPIPTANSLYNKTLKERTASGIFDSNVEGYIFYPADDRFIIGIKVSSYSLYKYTFGLHQNRDFSGAIARYQKLKYTPQVPGYIVDSSNKNIELAEQKRIPSANPILYTDYNISLDKAVALQMKNSAQTDKHYAYVSKDYVKNGKVTASTLNVRGGPGSSYKVVGKLTSGAAVKVLSETNIWYQIEFRSGQWVHAAEADVRYYMNPLNFVNDAVQRFQFLDLSRPSDATASSLNRFLEDKGILRGKGSAFIEASLIHGVSDIYLVSHALLETGNGASDLATGIEVGKNNKGKLTLVTTKNRSSLTNIKTTYNMYGIGAVDNNAHEGGAFTAYQRGWFTPESAIIGGAAFIGNNYIKAGQNTLYKMRWNPAGMANNGYATHQYATDIGWAYKQVRTMYNLYNLLDNYVLYLDIPLYEN